MALMPGEQQPLCRRAATVGAGKFPVTLDALLLLQPRSARAEVKAMPDGQELKDARRFAVPCNPTSGRLCCINVH